MNTERKTKNPGSLVEKIATGKANALEIDHDDLLIGKFIFLSGIPELRVQVRAVRAGAKRTVH